MVELEPKNANNHLMLARAALMLSYPAAARQALDQVDTATRQTADYHKLQANLEWSSGRLTEAERHFAEASRLEPTNLVSKMNLNLIRLPSTNASVAASARAASTYALSLHFQRQTKQALLVMERLPSERLETPAIAAWYGYLLAEAGQRQRAQKYLPRAEKARLLPEEKRLLAKARGES